MRAAMIRVSGAASWLGFFVFVLAAWGVLFAMQPEAGETAMLNVYGSDLWASLCAPLTGQSSYGVVFAMWALMSGAMMAPTFVPTLRTYRNLTHTEAANGATFVVLNVAYLSVWLGFSAVAAAAQLVLARQGVLPGGFAGAGWGFSAVLLATAGAYQFSRLKDACLTACRAPLMFFMQHWKPGTAGALVMGWRLGVVCVGCCWALMSLGFVGGVMNLVWMGIATLLMALEKLPQIGGHITRPLGVLLLAASVFATLKAFGI